MMTKGRAKIDSQDKCKHPGRKGRPTGIASHTVSLAAVLSSPSSAFDKGHPSIAEDFSLARALGM